MILSTKLKTYKTFWSVKFGYSRLVGLYPSIPQKTDLNALREALDNTENKQLPKITC